MARSSSRGDLFITVGGDVTPLRSAMKAGKSVLNEFGMAAIDIQKEVGNAFANMGANAPAQAKKLEQAFAATFAEIRRNAQAVLSAPANDQAIGILNAAGAREAAAAAEAEATALRQVADAAARADAAAGGTNAGVRLLAVSSETAAVQAAQHAAALKTQAAALETVQAELGTAAGAEEAFNASQTGMVRVSNAGRMAQMELLHSVRASVDQFAFGTPIAQIFSLQVAQLGQAAALAGESFGKVGRFLSGPWGIALIAATSLVATLISKHQGAAKSAKEQGDAEAVLTAYINGETVANDALVTALEKIDQQRRKSLQTTNEQIRAEAQLAAQTLATAQAKRADLEAGLAKAKAVASAPTVLTPGGTAEASGGEARAAVSTIEQSIADVDRVIGKASDVIAADLTSLARNLSTNVGRANDEFDRQQAALEARFRNALQRPGANRDQLQQQLSAAEEKLGAARARAVDAAQKLDQAEQGQAQSAARAATATHEYGRRIDFAAAEAIAKGAGLTVTSGYRSEAKQAELYRTVRTPQNPVARPGTSAHEGVNGKWALDIAFAPGLTPARLKKIYGDQGVTLSAVYKESGHYHIEGSRGAAAPAGSSPPPGTAAHKATDQDDYFAQQMQQLNGSLIQARGELLGSVEAQARFSTEQVEAERQSYDLAVQKALDDGRIRDTQAQELTARNDALAAQRKANIAVQAFIRKQDEIQKTLDQDYDLRQQDLRYRYDMATSSKARRDLAMQILDLEYQQKKSDLEIARAKATEAQNWAEVARIDQQLAALPAQKAQAQGEAARQNQSPMQDYLSKLPHTLDDVRDRLEEIQVTALHELEDSASRALTKVLGLKGPLADIADMLLKLAFETAFGALFPNGFGGARASGGPVNSSKWYVVGENGPEIFVPSSSGTIVPNGMASASAPRPVSLTAANANPAPQRIIVELRDELLTATIAKGAQVEIIRAYPAMKADTLRTIDEKKRRAA